MGKKRAIMDISIFSALENVCTILSRKISEYNNFNGKLVSSSGQGEPRTSTTITMYHDVPVSRE